MMKLNENDDHAISHFILITCVYMVVLVWIVWLL